MSIYCSLFCCSFFFFFFQAEDGIRDRNVTGVQTCALPISGLDIVGAIIFPTGFVMILLLNLELVTGSFAIIPIANMRGLTTKSAMFRNLSWAFIGNLLGALFYAVLFTISISKFGHHFDSALIDKVIAVAETKTI